MRTALWMLVIPCVMTSPGGQTSTESAATVPQIHKTMITASEVIFNVGREAPKDDEEWTAISTAGAVLIESGNLLMRASALKDQSKWIALSRQLVTTGQRARRETNARNLDALIRTTDRLALVCETCHARYRKPRFGP